MIKLKPSEEYIFSLLDINLIDFDNIDFDTDNKTISLPLIITNVPIITDNLDDDICLLINDAILDGDMWFTYNAVDHNIEALTVECHAVQSITDIATIISLIEYQHPEYEKYKTAYDNFNALVKERLKQQIRKIMTDVKGEFVIVVQYQKSESVDNTLSIKNHVEKYISLGYKTMDAIKAVSKDRNIPKSEVYSEYHREDL